MISLALEGEYYIMVRIVSDVEISKLKQFNFHGIPNNFTCLLDFGDWMIDCHVWESTDNMFVMFNNFLDLDMFIQDMFSEILLTGWYKAIEIHKIFSEGSCLIKADKIN